ncbi:MAG: GNAT family N-acetyltransferase [Anaerolineae bacterium]
MALIEIRVEDRHKLASLFEGHFAGFTADSILEGHTGRALADSADQPTFAVLELPKIQVCILGGDASHALASTYIQGLSQITQVFYSSPDFVALFNQLHPGKIIPRQRWAFSAENLDVEHLKQLKANVSNRFRIVPLNVNIVKQLSERKNKFAAVHGVTFKSPEEFIEKGFGYCVLEGETESANIACVGSSFAICEAGIEIQIDTKSSYQGNGLATAIAASVMLHSLEKGLVPGWDAATPISASLAEKLGYTAQGEYDMLIFTNSRFLVYLRNFIHATRRLFKGDNNR